MSNEIPIFKNPLCAEVDPELFFPMEVKGVSTLINVRNAKKVCGSCEHRLECLEFALVNNVQGIWGGVTERERHALRKARGISKVSVPSSKFIFISKKRKEIG